MDRTRAFRRRVARLLDAISGDGSLDEATLAISTVLRPGIDEIGVLADLDQLAADCPTPTRDGVMHHLFGAGEGGRPQFTGDRSTYHAWQNSCLDLVIGRRTGMPITLAVVAIEVARRTGVRLVGVGAPGHFLVGDPADPDWFADPFHGVTGLDRDDCRTMLLGTAMRQWDDRVLAPVASRTIVQRILNNLAASVRRADSGAMAAMVAAMRAELPEFADERAGLPAAVAPLN